MIENLLSISEFGKIVDIDRKTLIYYDQIGLFTPRIKRENGYRQYHPSQVYELCIIMALADAGLSLSEIKPYTQNRNPDEITAVFKKQIPKLKNRLRRIESVIDMMEQRIQAVGSVTALQINKVEISPRPESYLYLSQPLEIDKSSAYDERWNQFFIDCYQKNISKVYLVGFLIAKESIMQNQADIAKCFAFRVNDPQRANHILPGGTYAMMYCNRLYAANVDYQTARSQIEMLGYRIIGDSFEEGVIDDVMSLDNSHFISKLQIPVERK